MQMFLPKDFFQLVSLAIAVFGLSCGSKASDVSRLQRYNAPISESSISGISSGAFMAVQFGTAWSSVIQGVGVIAGGPFWCAKADADDIFNAYTLPVYTATGPCMKGPPPEIDAFLGKAEAKAAAGEIDAPRNLARQKIYLFHGYNDSVVAKSVTDMTAEFYLHYLGKEGRGNLFYQTALGSGHSLVVLRQLGENGLNDCTDNESPYIDQCGYDQAGVLLQHIYGALNPPNRGKLQGSVIRFDQSAYSQPDDPNSIGLGDSGYVFVPKDCDGGAECRVHIALHGCKQDEGDIDRRFIDETGYNAWADSNRLIILYPQTRSSWYLPSNPEACWDWWGYVNHDDSYVTKSGAQIRTINAMLTALTTDKRLSSQKAATQSFVPHSLAVTDTSETSAALAWAPVEKANSYRVWRAEAHGQFDVVGTVSGPSFGDSGLRPKSAFRWRVSAIVNGLEQPSSAEVVGMTRPQPAPCDSPGSCRIVP
jgi:hypothetical protein